MPFFRRPPAPSLADVITSINQLKATIVALQDEINALKAEIASNTTVEQSAATLIRGFNAKLDAAVAAAAAAGATPEQLSSLEELKATLTTNDEDLAAAVAANTAPPPTS